MAYMTVNSIHTLLTSKMIPAFSKLASVFGMTNLQGAGAAAGIGALVIAILEIAKNWDKMNDLEKMIAILGALAIAAGTAAVAFGAVQGAAGAAIAALAIVGGIAMVAGAINSAKSRVPALAEGAVLPPNQPFAAIVGDQKRGINIEAPLETIKQGVAEVLAETGGAGGSQTTILEIDGKEFARIIRPYSEQENKRVGVRMSIN